MKTTKEFLIEKIDAETPAFIRMFEAIPAQNLDYKPDSKSKSALELASQLVEEAHQMAEIFATGKADIDPSKMKVYASVSELAPAFQEGVDKTKAELTKLTDADWDAPAEMLMNGQSFFTDKKGDMVWGYLLDMIHHRGQLSTYLRPMGGKVPSIYGPSADTQN